MKFPEKEVKSLWNTKKELKNRLGALLGVRVTTENRDNFLEELFMIKKDLERCYENLHTSPSGSETERQYIARIAVLEDARFEILNRLNGQRIEDYGHYPVDIRS